MRWWNTPLRADIADTRGDLAGLLEGEGAHIWAVREADKAVGFVGLLGDVAVPGLTWLLCKQAWGRGLMTEAAAAVVEYAFRSLGLARVEAWVATTNVRSQSVARRIGLTEYGRLAQRYPHREQPHEFIVLGRSQRPEPTTVLGIEVVLPVVDVGTALDLLRSVFGVRILYDVGDPREVVGVVFGPWSVGPSVRLVATTTPIAPITVSVDVGTEFASTYGRAGAAGADIVAPPVEQPWGIREFVMRLADGHQFVVGGPA